MNPLNYKKVIFIKKEWGKEEIIHNDKDYCGKILHLYEGYKCSLHYHKEKKETFYLLEGEIIIQLIDKKFHMKPGDHVTITPGTYHAFYGMKHSKILEISTQDFEEDSYRSDLSGLFNIFKLREELGC